ncbi:hypothetical protein FRB97_000738 [Tulasnella sp. 331]|nr:hypothetical protein FRB97_000738 [Tulasnella sp. 331]
MAPDMPTPPPGDRFPVLWHFIYRIECTPAPHFKVFRNHLLALSTLLHTPGQIDGKAVRRQCNSIRDVYNELRHLKLWGTKDNEQRAFELLEAEILTAFPEPAPGGKLGRTLAIVGGGALAVTGATIVLPAIAVGGLGLLGFSAVGPVAGSIAATIQSVCYGGAVASGSAFALAQAAAMGGIAVGSAAEIVAGAFAVTAGAGLIGNALGGAEDRGEDDESPDGKDGH